MHPPRLHRLPTLFTSWPLYFITVCTYHRQRLLNTSAIHDAFLAFARSGRERGITVGRYVLMPDHAHLFATFSNGAPSLPIWIKSLKNTISKELRRQNIPGPHWQKGYFDHVMRSNESYAQKWVYVAENPVRAGLVQKAEEWPFQGELFQLGFPEP
ncbi:MAG: REP-associated tyrosine transposase [Terriglobia bacterium]